MHRVSTELQLNGFGEHHEADMRSTTNGLRRSSSSSTSSIDRLEREFATFIRPRSIPQDQDDHVDDEIIQEIRRRVLDTTNRFQEQFDESDIKWISDTDDMIFRNVLVYRDKFPKHKNMDSLYSAVHDAVIGTLKWRHDFGVNTTRDEDIPKEFFDTKAVLFYIGTDGRLYLYVKARKYKKFSHVWTDIIIRFGVHEIDKRLKEFSYKYKRGVYELNTIIIVDGNSTGMAQVDLKNFFLCREIFLNHYPKTFKELWIFGMPWWAKPFVTIALKALPAYVTDFCKLVSTESMIEEVGAENVPKSLGGDRAEIFVQPPEHTVTVEQVGRRVGASRSEIKRLIEHLSSVAE